MRHRALVFLDPKLVGEILVEQLSNSLCKRFIKQINQEYNYLPLPAILPHPKWRRFGCCKKPHCECVCIVLTPLLSMPPKWRDISASPEDRKHKKPKSLWLQQSREQARGQGGRLFVDTFCGGAAVVNSVVSFFRTGDLRRKLLYRCYSRRLRVGSKS